MRASVSLLSNEDLIAGFISRYSSRATKKQYRNSLREYARFLGGKTLQQATPLDVEEYFNYTNNSDLKKKTRAGKYAAVVSFYKHYLHLQAIDTNGELGLAIDSRIGAVVNYKRRWREDRETNAKVILTSAEILKVIEVLREESWKYCMMFYVIADTSMRPNGLCNIQVSNILWGKRIIKTFDKGKMRGYCFGKALKKELQQYVKSQGKMRRMVRTKHLFFAKTKQYNPDSISSYIFPKRISPLVKRLTKKYITASCLRTSFETNRLNLGQNKEQVDRLMSHKTYLDEYSRPTDEMLLSWFDAYEEL